MAFFVNLPFVLTASVMNTAMREEKQPVLLDFQRTVLQEEKEELSWEEP